MPSSVDVECQSGGRSGSVVICAGPVLSEKVSAPLISPLFKPRPSCNSSFDDVDGSDGLERREKVGRIGRDLLDILLWLSALNGVPSGPTEGIVGLFGGVCGELFKIEQML